MERPPQQTIEMRGRGPSNDRHLHVVGAAVVERVGADVLPLSSLCVDIETERRLDWPTHRVAIQMWTRQESATHPRILSRVAEQLRGRHSASWFIPLNGVRVHFSVGDWEGDLDSDIARFTAELGELLGADPDYIKLDRVPIDIPAALAQARELGVYASELYLTSEANGTGVGVEAIDLTPK